MWVRVSRLEGGSADRLDESLSHLEEQILPAARQMRGWKGVLSLSSADRSSRLTLTFWDSEEAMRD